MISGTFHPVSQDWRYYAREKSLVHTLHLAQLPASLPGDSVFILLTPPTGTQLNLPGFTLPPLPVWGGGNTILLPTGTYCYGYYNNRGGTILTDSKNAQVNPSLGGGADVISIIPQVGGLFQLDGWSLVDNNGGRMPENTQQGFTVYVENTQIGVSNVIPAPDDYSAVGCTLTYYVHRCVNQWSSLYRLTKGQNVNLRLDHSLFTRQAVSLAMLWLSE